MDQKTDTFEVVGHRRPIAGDTRGCSMMKMDLRFKNTKLSHYLELMKNGPPIEHMKERKVVKTVSEDEKYIYIRVSPGGFVSDRDQVVKKTIERLQDGKTLMCI